MKRTAILLATSLLALLPVHGADPTPPPRPNIILLALTTTAQAWQPAPDSMLTEWGENLTPESAWTEYPRPAFVRDNWINLNGLGRRLRPAR